MTDGCEEVRRELPAYMGRELDRSGIDHIDAHLRGCPTCRQTLNTLGEMVRLVPMAPLEHTPRAGLEDHVLRMLDLDDAALLAADAPLSHEPPVDLEARSLAHAGIVARPRQSGRWPRVAAVLAPGLAVATVALAVVGANWRSDARTLQATLGGVLGSQAPAGETMDAVTFDGPAASATGELVDLTDDNYSLVLYALYLPITPPGFHYEVWLVGKRGTVPAGNFTVTRPGPIRETFSIGVDPRDFPVVRMTREPDNGTEGSSGWMVMEARFDIGRP